LSRPTIRDLAAAADVSVATVNRVLAGTQSVKAATMQRVKEAAADIGFYGLGAIESRVARARAKYRFGFVLQQSSRAFYKNLALALRQATERVDHAQVEIQVEFIEDLAPQNIAAKMLELAETCDAVGVVAAVHPIVMQAVEALEAQGIPVFALISQLASTGRVHFIGCDGWKTGRTAAWMFHHACNKPGKLGLLVGNTRYRCQEMNESGFRSYFREHANEFTVLEPLLTFESAAVSQEMTERLLRENPDLRGLYVAGGGISGAIAALRSTGVAGKVTLVGHDMMDVVREALLDGTMTLSIAHPVPRLCDTALAGMIRAVNDKAEAGNYTTVLPFDLYTRENI
jgi:LacI family transcriptional regulator